MTHRRQDLAALVAYTEIRDGMSIKALRDNVPGDSGAMGRTRQPWVWWSEQGWALEANR